MRANDRETQTDAHARFRGVGHPMTRRNALLFAASLGLSAASAGVGPTAAVTPTANRGSVRPEGYDATALKAAFAEGVSTKRPVELEAGTYNAGGSRLTIPAGLVLIGAGIGQTVIASNVLFHGRVDVSDMTIGISGQRSGIEDGSSNGTIRRVQFRGGSSQSNLYLNNSFVTKFMFEDCQFCDNTSGGNGVQIVDQGTRTKHYEDIAFVRCHFYNNDRMNFECIQRSEVGPVVLGYRRIDLLDCVFEAPRNVTGQNMGVSYDSEYLSKDGTTPSSGYSRVVNCKILGGGYALELARATHMEIIGNEIHGGKSRILSTSGINHEPANNAFVGNRFIGSVAKNIVVFQGSGNLIVGNEVSSPGHVQLLRCNRSVLTDNAFETTGDICLLLEDAQANELHRNHFTGGATYSVHLTHRASADNRFIENRVSGAGADFQVDKGILGTQLARNKTKRGGGWVPSTGDLGMAVLPESKVFRSAKRRFKRILVQSERGRGPGAS
jgi:hypothetical protein